MVVYTGKGFFEGVTEATPWRVYAFILRGRTAYLQVPDATAAAGGRHNHWAYCRRLAHLIKYLSEEKGVHLVAKEHTHRKLSMVLYNLMRGYPGILRSGITDLTKVYSAEALRRSRADWQSVADDQPPLPVAPLSVDVVHVLETYSARTFSQVD